MFSVYSEVFITTIDLPFSAGRMVIVLLLLKEEMACLSNEKRIAGRTLGYESLLMTFRLAVISNSSQSTELIRELKLFVSVQGEMDVKEFLLIHGSHTFIPKKLRVSILDKILSEN